MGFDLIISHLLCHSLGGTLSLESTKVHVSLPEDHPPKRRLLHSKIDSSNVLTDENNIFDYHSLDDTVHKLPRCEEVKEPVFNRYEKVIASVLVKKTPSLGQLPEVSPIKVLVVDDTAYNIFVMKELLSQIKPRDIEVLTACNGQAAVEVVTELNKPGRAAPISLVFMDIQMPIMDGF